MTSIELATWFFVSFLAGGAIGAGVFRLLRVTGLPATRLVGAVLSCLLGALTGGLFGAMWYPRYDPAAVRPESLVIYTFVWFLNAGVAGVSAVIFGAGVGQRCPGPAGDSYPSGN